MPKLRGMNATREEKRHYITEKNWSNGHGCVRRGNDLNLTWDSQGKYTNVGVRIL